MSGKGLPRVRRLGLTGDMPEFERRWHELANLFCAFIFSVVAIYNLVYAVMGAWLLWAFNAAVLLLIGVSFGLLALRRVMTSRLLFVVATAFGIASLAVGLGPDSNLLYLTFLACLVVPLLVPGGLGIFKVAAFASAAGAYFVVGQLHPTLPITPPFPADTRSWIEDSCILVCTVAIAYTIMRLMDFLTASHRNMDALLRALPDPWLRVAKDGTILEHGSSSLDIWQGLSLTHLAALFPAEMEQHLREDMARAASLQ